MRLIDKDALMAVLGITDEECSKCDLGDGNGYCTFSTEWTTACDEICTAPIIEERKKGKWELDTKSGRYRCSECLAVASRDDFGKEYLSDYCTVCGARMNK